MRHASNVSAASGMWSWQHGADWRPYGVFEQESLELAFSRQIERVDIDSSRYVNLKSMRQIRKDDEGKQRYVKRTEQEEGAPPKRPQQEGEPSKQPRTDGWTERDARDVARRLANPSEHTFTHASVSLLPADAPSVVRYARVRRALRHHDVALLGFKLFAASDEVLSAAEAHRILHFLSDGIQWEPRRGSGGRALEGTERKSFGVDLDDKYVVTGSAAMPPLLEALGQRLLKLCRSTEWPYARGDLRHTPRFEQCFVQKYPAGNSPASTLGFHFDGRTTSHCAEPAPCCSLAQTAPKRSRMCRAGLELRMSRHCRWARAPSTR
jgi:hypothetical protein